jgi:hypothetical protein
MQRVGAPYASGGAAPDQGGSFGGGGTASSRAPAPVEVDLEDVAALTDVTAYGELDSAVFIEALQGIFAHRHQMVGTYRMLAYNYHEVQQSYSLLDEQLRSWSDNVEFYSLYRVDDVQRIDALGPDDVSFLMLACIVCLFEFERLPFFPFSFF